jgi:hypothetical protein
LVTARAFEPAFRLSSRIGVEFVALAMLVESDPADLVSILGVLSVTDTVMRDAAHSLASFSPAMRYRGTSAAAVMLPFLCPRVSRFSSGRYGVFYGGDCAETAVAEVSYHHGRRLRATSAPGGTSVALTLWAFVVKDGITDVRECDRAIYEPDNYRAAQLLGQRVRDHGARGVLYRSVRRRGSECVGIFVPSAVRTMEKRDDWRLIWNGSTISEVLRVAS